MLNRRLFDGGNVVDLVLVIHVVVILVLMIIFVTRSPVVHCTEATLVEQLITTERPDMGPREARFWREALIEAATAARVSPSLFAAVIAVENRFYGKGLSATGAQGAGQVMPSWLGKPQCAKGTNLQEIEPNLRCAAAILRYELDESKGDVQQALRRYNAGPQGQAKVQQYADQTQLKLARAQFARCAPFVKEKP